jgi:DNA polymerase-3 subunit delta
MQLRIDALDGHVAKPLAQLYVITSDEHLLALEAADKIRRAARAQGYSERDVLTVERSFKWGELLAANQEIQKLGLLHAEGKLTYEQVQDAVLNVARYDVFKLSEAMLAGDPARLVRMLEGLKGEGEALPLVLWAVSEEIRTLLKLKAGMAQGRPLGALLKEYRIWGPRERMMEPALRRISLPVLEAALQQAAQVDKMIKGLRAKGYAGDAWDAMLQLGLKIARG